MAPAILTVTTVADTVAVDMQLSLREAILSINNQMDVNSDANTHRTGTYGPIDTINFSIAGTSVHTIFILTALPTITHSVVIDGFSEPGTSPNTLADGDNANRLIELSGAALPGGVGAGLAVTAGSSTIQGLTIDQIKPFGFLNGGNAISLDGGGGNTVRGNYLASNFGSGVIVSGSSSSNLIGGTNPGDRNVIAGNIGGVGIFSSLNNLVQGNFIGTDRTGRAGAGNQGAGVFLDRTSGNLIGGTSAGARNILSGNSNSGVFIQNSGPNQVKGNYIGTDVTGTMPIGNAIYGIFLFGSNSTTIGGTTAGERNTISGNGGGIHFDQASGNFVQGNYIGTDVTGTAALPNVGDGIGVVAAADTIGGTAPGAGNVISGNGGNGVDISAANSSVIQGNYIGTDAAGTATVSNVLDGVLLVNGGSGNLVGGTVAGAGNIISGNNGQGVEIRDEGGNTVQGNSIGTDASGQVGLGNSGDGVFLSSANNNLIGGPRAGNVISSNHNTGVRIDHGGNNTLQGNLIGTDVSGTQALGNTLDGVFILLSNDNQIGGIVTGAGNVISGNGRNGVFFSFVGANVVQGNRIGTDKNGSIGLGNVGDGVFIGTGSNVSIGGGAGAGNLISGNGSNGVEIGGTPSNQFNKVKGNQIGTDATGIYSLANAGNGVLLGSTASLNTIGGTVSGDGNLISGNSANGVEINGGTSNVVQGNSIGTDATGTAADLGNGNDGVRLQNGAQMNQIGGPPSGPAAAFANKIAFNAAAGVVVGTDPNDSNTLNNPIRGNAIYANGALGIDLADDLVTPNDSGPTGPNHFQNYPEQLAALTGATTLVSGTLNTPLQVNTTFTLDFYANPAADSSGFGQGQLYLGQGSVKTGGSGNATFGVPKLLPAPPGWFITATATDPNGNTSEFSADAHVCGANAAANLLQNGGFELPAGGGTFRAPDTSPPKIPGWNLLFGSVDIVTPWSASAVEGNQVLDLDGLSHGTIQQSFATLPGQTYELAFAYANNPDVISIGMNSASARVEVFSPTAVVTQDISHSDSTHTDLKWLVYCQTFVASDTTTTLRFTSTDPSTNQAYGIVLDAVSVSAVPAPDGALPALARATPARDGDPQPADNRALAAALPAAQPSPFTPTTTPAAPNPTAALAPRLDTASIDQFFASLHQDDNWFGSSRSRERASALWQLQDTMLDVGDDWSANF